MFSNLQALSVVLTFQHATLGSFRLPAFVVIFSLDDDLGCRTSSPAERESPNLMLEVLLTVFSVSHICQSGFPLPFLQFLSFWVSFFYGRSSLTGRGFPLTSLSSASSQLLMQTLCVWIARRYWVVVWWERRLSVTGWSCGVGVHWVWLGGHVVREEIECDWVVVWWGCTLSVTGGRVVWV